MRRAEPGSADPRGASGHRWIPASALALGALQGPLELLPVSSSAHVAALTWGRAGWDGARRKELEVALHAGTALALLLVAPPPRPRPALLAAACAPPAFAGLLLERRVEERLGTPATLAAGLLAGAAALVRADRARGARIAAHATWRDGLWLGAAQTAALWPGVSRSGATLAAARALGFTRPEASRLSWEAGLPVLAGATALKAIRIGGRPPGHLAAAAGAACASTLVAARTLGVERRRPLWPWALWRAGLAAAVLAVRENRRR